MRSKIKTKLKKQNEKGEITVFDDDVKIQMSDKNIVQEVLDA